MFLPIRTRENLFRLSTTYFLMIAFLSDFVEGAQRVQHEKEKKTIIIIILFITENDSPSITEIFNAPM